MSFAILRGQSAVISSDQSTVLALVNAPIVEDAVDHSFRN
jgi:hypothetical protein